MKTSFLALILALTLLVSGGGDVIYGKDTAKNSDYASTTGDIVFLKKLEQIFVKEKQKNDKLKMGSLSVYQKDLVRGIEQKHPDYTKIINLGELPYPLADFSDIERGAPATASKHYLLEVQDNNDVFYYGVSVIPVFRAPSDVIPAHISKVFISVRPIGKTELVELLKSLQEK